MPEAHPDLVHYLPMLTTLLAAAFCSVILRRWALHRSGPHLLWWGMGVFFYGLGTAIESAITLAGNTVFLNKSWYIAGALLGGYPLAQGTVFLLLSRRTALALTALTLPLIVVLSICVWLSPVELSNLEGHRPSGAILGWTWIRAMTPIINGYAALFLIGGAILSAWRYARRAGAHHRALGNAAIAFGAILPGIGGGMAKAGIVEALYIGEFIGLIFIWIGYGLCVRSPVAATSPELTTAGVAAS